TEERRPLRGDREDERRRDPLQRGTLRRRDRREDAPIKGEVCEGGEAPRGRGHSPQREEGAPDRQGEDNEPGCGGGTPAGGHADVIREPIIGGHLHQEELPEDGEENIRGPRR